MRTRTHALQFKSVHQESSTIQNTNLNFAWKICSVHSGHKFLTVLTSNWAHTQPEKTNTPAYFSPFFQQGQYLLISFFIISNVFYIFIHLLTDETDLLATNPRKASTGYEVHTQKGVKSNIHYATNRQEPRQSAGPGTGATIASVRPKWGRDHTLFQEFMLPSRECMRTLREGPDGLYNAKRSVLKSCTHDQHLADWAGYICMFGYNIYV